MRAPIIATRSVRTMTRRPWLSLGLLVFSFLLPAPAAAVVCAFTNFMPNGPEPVGFAEDWVTTSAGATPTHLQWWFPARLPEANPPDHLSLRDYALSRTRDPRLPEPQATTLARRELNQRAEAARARGASPVRSLHVGAAAMLAIQDATPRPGPWPLVWVGGDSSFADQLASHGIVVVASPRAFGTSPDLESELDEAVFAVRESSKRFDIDAKRLGVLGFNDLVPLAARLAGALPEVDALAVVGTWPQPAHGGYWLDPAEISQATLYVHGVGAAAAPKTPPLDSPFARTEWMQFHDIDDAMLEFGLPNFCTPNYTPMAAPVHSMVLLQTQYALRLRLAEFFSSHFDLRLQAAKMQLPPLATSRLQPITITEQQSPARWPAPPSGEEVARRLQQGGSNAVLAGLPKEIRAQLPARWWQMALDLAAAVSSEAGEPLLQALETAHPDSGLAATLRAEQALATNRANAQRLGKRALKRIDRDRQLSPPLRAQLRARLSGSLPSRE